ncbi:MAG: lysoplasmalogenase [Lachnospiraceae bacterium]|nr:lysoplasmalogenase [Lachnospiraceae bacterium]
MKYIFLILLVIASAIHLYDSWNDNKRRGVTKPFLLLFIIGYYLCSTDKPYWVLIAALVTSWLGDVLLIPKGHKWFTMGGISFLFCHFLFIGVYMRNIDISKVNFAVVIPIAAVYYTIVFIVIKNLYATTPKPMIPPMCIYLLANATMNVFALKQLFSNPGPGAIVAYAGAVLFFISDCTLYLVRYYKNPDIVFKRHFTVMLTYILGELLITQGVIMLGI